ncbi:zinc ribbon domain-containing protein [Rubellicoccus peritrichatus]|uniref:FmdB family zinc ribbon protein n=1 Tax=Rubellicoccus peritrichatus TaxID=3080537 RepID=UPI0031F2E4A5
MPIYEYKCESCDKEFEILVQGTAAVKCPECDSEKLEKQLSVFRTSGSGQMQSAGCGCSKPTGGCCSN